MHRLNELADILNTGDVTCRSSLEIDVLLAGKYEAKDAFPSFGIVCMQPKLPTQNMRRRLLRSTSIDSTVVRRRAAFSSSSQAYYVEGSRGSSSEAGEKSKQRKSTNSEERPGTTGRSPFAVFVSVLREELQKSRELSVKLVHRKPACIAERCHDNADKTMSSSYKGKRVKRWTRKP